LEDNFSISQLHLLQRASSWREINGPKLYSDVRIRRLEIDAPFVSFYIITSIAVLQPTLTISFYGYWTYFPLN